MEEKQNKTRSYLDSFEPFPTPVPFQSLDSIPTYKKDINVSGIT